MVILPINHWKALGVHDRFIAVYIPPRIREYEPLLTTHRPPASTIEMILSLSEKFEYICSRRLYVFWRELALVLDRHKKEHWECWKLVFIKKTVSRVSHMWRKKPSWMKTPEKQFGGLKVQLAENVSFAHIKAIRVTPRALIRKLCLLQRC